MSKTRFCCAAAMLQRCNTESALCCIWQDIELRKPRKQLEFVWRGSPDYGSYGDIWTYAMETGLQMCGAGADKADVYLQCPQYIVTIR